MIRNLVTSGCSFTEGPKGWADAVCRALNISNLYNMGAGSAGNRYIANSVIDVIEYNDLEPEETLVLVMWSGPNRCDQTVAGEYWYLLSDYNLKTKYRDFVDTYWVFSGGSSNGWIDHPETVKLFKSYYVTADPFSMTKATLENISKLQNYLENHGFEYRFMSYLNYWNPDASSGANGDYSLAYFGKDMPAYQKMEFNKWIFCNNAKDCAYEFCRDCGLLSSDEFHPTTSGYHKFVEDVILPQLKGFKQ